MHGALAACARRTRPGRLAPRRNSLANFTEFAQCPYKNLEVKKCIYSTTESGEVVLGNKKVPIEKPVILQGGYAETGGRGFAKFFAATNGITLSKAPQNVPGGLLGIVPEAPRRFWSKR